MQAKALLLFTIVLVDGIWCLPLPVVNMPAPVKRGLVQQQCVPPPVDPSLVQDLSLVEEHLRQTVESCPDVAGCDDNIVTGCSSAVAPQLAGVPLVLHWYRVMEAEITFYRTVAGPAESSEVCRLRAVQEHGGLRAIVEGRASCSGVPEYGPLSVSGQNFSTSWSGLSNTTKSYCLFNAIHGNLWRLANELNNNRQLPRLNRPTIRQGEEMLNFTNQRVIPEMNDSQRSNCTMLGYDNCTMLGYDNCTMLGYDASDLEIMTTLTNISTLLGNNSNMLNRIVPIVRENLERECSCTLEVNITNPISLEDLDFGESLSSQDLVLSCLIEQAQRALNMLLHRWNIRLCSN